MNIDSPEEIVTTYTYEALLSADHTRLIELHAHPDSEAPLRAQFIQINAEESFTQYDAISYTWGGQPSDQILEVSPSGSITKCSQVLITKNLANALTTVRYPNKSRLLWADALCINQSDDLEKAQQIPIMARIFRGATRVLAWLDGDADEERGMQQLGKISRYWRFDVKQKMKGLPGPDLPIWERRYVRDFLHLSWFTRLWIVQEVVFSADVTLFCGSSELSWLRLIIALDTISKISAEGTEFIGYGVVSAVRSIGALWRHHCTIDDSHSEGLENESASDMLLLMHRFHNYGCTDARDRIFALYNVSESMQPTLSQQRLRKESHSQQYIYMDVDYRNTIEEIYKNFAIACLESGRAATFLNSVLWRATQQHAADWPSWVPDWRTSPTESNLMVERTEYCRLEGSRICSFVIRNMLSAIPDCWHPAIRTKLNTDSLGSFITALEKLAKMSSIRTMSWLLAMLVPKESELHPKLEQFVRDLQIGANILALQDPQPPRTGGSLRFKELWDGGLELEAEFNDLDSNEQQDKYVMRHADMIHHLQRAMQHKCFFTAALTRSSPAPDILMGFADGEFRVGDRLGAFKAPQLSAKFCFGGTPALVLRPQNFATRSLRCYTCTRRNIECEGLFPSCIRCTQQGQDCHYEEGYEPPLYTLMGSSCVAPCRERTFENPEVTGKTVIRLI